MKNLTFHNHRLITYSDEQFTIDVLGGVDTYQLERMVCTLRIAFEDYPYYRTTLDLYSDQQTDKLISTLCDKWTVPLVAASKSVHNLIAQLENLKLENLKHAATPPSQDFVPDVEQEAKAKRYLSRATLIQSLQSDLRHIGILGEDQTATILFMAMASHKFSNPFSVLALAKSGTGKSYLLQKLSECMPPYTFSFHTQISENALYYFDSHQIDGKALFIEDLAWTQKMMNPLSTLQTQGRLIKTRPTKDKDGLMHSASFQLAAKLCLIGCVNADKNYEKMSLPFLCIHLNETSSQDKAIMEYQKKCKAGLIKPEDIKQTQHHLRCVIATLQNVNIINPYAQLIELPDEIMYPRRSLMLVLDFIEIVTFFFQYQREKYIDKTTGEEFVKTHPDDIQLAFDYLKGHLLKKSDELSAATRSFFDHLNRFLEQAGTKQFTALDVRQAYSQQAKVIHPRTLNRYLQELKLFSYIQVIGGNKHRQGYRYKLTGLGNQAQVKDRIEQALSKTMQTIRKTHSTTSPAAESDVSKECSGIDYTYKILKQDSLANAEKRYTAKQVAEMTGKNKRTENQLLMRLFKQGLLDREIEPKSRQYLYSLKKENSRTVGQNTVSNSENK